MEIGGSSDCDSQSSISTAGDHERRSPAHLIAAACRWQPSSLAAAAPSPSGSATGGEGSSGCTSRVLELGGEQQGPEAAQERLEEQAQANGKEGAAERRSLVHPSFGLWQQQQGAEVEEQPAEVSPSAASSPALSSASLRPHASAVPSQPPAEGQPVRSRSDSPPHHRKAWAAGCSHIELHFDEAVVPGIPDQGGSKPESKALDVPGAAAAGPATLRDLALLWTPPMLPAAPAPAAAEAVAGRAVGPAHAVGVPAAGQYDQVLHRFCQLDVTKLK